MQTVDKDTINKTLALMRPDDLWPSWRLIDAMQQAGTMSEAEAETWKAGIYQLLKRWNLEPGDIAK